MIGAPIPEGFADECPITATEMPEEMARLLFYVRFDRKHPLPSLLVSSRMRSVQTK